MLADRRTVSDLCEIVDLDAATNAGLADTGTIDTGIGLHFNVTLQDRWARLCDLLPAVAVAGKAKAVATHYSAVLQDDIVPKRTELADDSVRVGKEAGANSSATIDDHMRQQDRVVADLDVIVDDHICADVGVRTQLCRRRNHRARMYSGAVRRSFVEQVNRPRKGEVRILAAQHRGGDSGEVLGDNHGGSGRRLGGRRILWIGDEGKFAS